MKTLLKRLIRACQYAVHGYNSFDWDFAYIEHDMLFKLKRVEIQLKKDSSFVEYEKKDLQSLRICIRLLDRLTDNDFSVNSDAVTRKWGELEFKKDTDSEYSVMQRTKVTTQEERTQCNKESMVAYTKDDEHQKRYRALFYKILQQYQHRWWS